MNPFSLAVVARGLGRLLSLEQCAACDEPLAFDESGFCPGCGLLLDPVDRSLAPPATTAALYMYGGPLAVALCRLKYEARTDLAQPLGTLLADAADAYGGRVDRLVPVPLHPERLRRRGYNQTALLGKRLARALGVPLDVRCLKRIRPTTPQAGLPREARRSNLRGAFVVRRGYRPDRVLVIDDVRTTGATLAEAAATLRDAGCPAIRCLSLAFAQS